MKKNVKLVISIMLAITILSVAILLASCKAGTATGKYYLTTSSGQDKDSYIEFKINDKVIVKSGNKTETYKIVKSKNFKFKFDNKEEKAKALVIADDKKNEITLFEIDGYIAVGAIYAKKDKKISLSDYGKLNLKVTAAANAYNQNKEKK